MHFPRIPLIVLFLAAMTLPALRGETEPPFTQEKDVVFEDRHGVGLLMDIFTPAGDGGNGRGLVVVASGGWSSSRGKIRDLMAGGVFEVFCKRGYHVFAVRPGSISRFSAADMIRHVEDGIRWVKSKASDYAIDPQKLGLFGASAGGHLASLTTFTTLRTDAKTDATVAAAVVFFPPTDFLNYGGKALSPRGDDRISQLLGGLAFRQGLQGISEEAISKALIAISPARLAIAEAPPFLLIHGDADPVVPLQQSEALLKALEAKKVKAKLVVKPNGGHPWPTIREEVIVAADWLDDETGVEGDS